MCCVLVGLRHISRYDLIWSTITKESESSWEGEAEASLGEIGEVSRPCHEVGPGGDGGRKRTFQGKGNSMYKERRCEITWQSAA